VNNSEHFLGFFCTEIHFTEKYDLAVVFYTVFSYGGVRVSIRCRIFGVGHMGALFLSEVLSV